MLTIHRPTVTTKSTAVLVLFVRRWWMAATLAARAGPESGFPGGVSVAALRSAWHVSRRWHHGHRHCREGS